MDMPPNDALPEGPYLSTAVICETVIREDDGVHSLVRIIDRATLGIPRARESNERIPFRTNLFLSFRAGTYEGEGIITIRSEDPSNTDQPITSAPVLFQGQSNGPQSGVNLVVKLTIAIRDPGTYWFNVFLNDGFVTRVPFQVEVELLEASVPEPIEAPAPQAEPAPQ